MILNVDRSLSPTIGCCEPAIYHLPLARIFKCTNPTEGPPATELYPSLDDLQEETSCRTSRQPSAQL